MANPTPRRQLLEPILDKGIQNVNYFNGRILTGRDLQEAATANQQQHAQLGQAIGDGVVQGLDVALVDKGQAGKPPVVSISKGLAVNRAGGVIALALDSIELALSKASLTLIPAGAFDDCQVQTTSTAPTNVGAYVLTAAPAFDYRDQAPTASLTAPNTTLVGCGSRYLVEGVKFRLLELPLADIVDSNTLLHIDDPVPQGLARNLLAHACFGTETLKGFGQDPFRLDASQSPYLAYGALDALRASSDAKNQLTDCDVPLAVLVWAPSGVKFIDSWAARRRTVQPLVGDPWPLHAGQRRVAEAEAVFLQFQAQLQAMLGEAGLSKVRAKDRFHYLPPAGYLPTGTGEFNRSAFFSGLDIEVTEVDPAFLRFFIHESWFLEPIDLTDTPPPPIVVFEAPKLDYLVFLRSERRPSPTATTGGPPPATEATTGQIRVTLKFEGATTGVIRYTQAVADVPPQQVRLINGVIAPQPQRVVVKYDNINVADRGDVLKQPDVVVTAADAKGKTYLLTYVSGRRFQTYKDELVRMIDGAVRFQSGDLPAGLYTIRAQAPGFRTSGTTAQVTPGGVANVTLTLIAETRDPGNPPTKPKGPAEIDWASPKWFDKGLVADKYVHWPWPPPEERPHFDPVVDPPPDAWRQWARDYAGYIAAQHPDAPIDYGNIQIYIDRTYTPDATPDAAYAYIVFGDQGAYAPLLMLPKGQSLDRGIALTKSGLAGVDLDVADKLADAGITRVDALAAAWKGLVSDTLDVTPNTAAQLVGDSRAQVRQLQGSVLMFDGVDAALETALAGIGVDNSVALANADPSALAQNAHIAPSFAQRLVDQARNTVPRAQWALDEGPAALKGDTIAALAAQGVTTQGTLKQKVGDANSLAAIASALNVTPAEATEMVKGIAVPDRAGFVKARTAEAPVVELSNVNRDTGFALAEAGLTSVGALADADVNHVAALLGGDQARAQAIVKAAATRLGR